MANLVTSIGLPLIGALTIVLSGCGTQNSSIDAAYETVALDFTFSTGGRYHSTGYGEWIVSGSAEGPIMFEHYLPETKRTYGPFGLEEKELSTLLSMLRGVLSLELESSTRTAEPGSVMWVLAIEFPESEQKIEIWEQDALAPRDPTTQQ